MGQRTDAIGRRVEDAGPQPPAAAVIKNKSTGADPTPKSPDGKPVQSLVDVLQESQHVKVLVHESACELSSVNKALKQGVADHDSSPGVEDALEKSEAVEDKVQQASGRLSEVNRSLAREITDRAELVRELAAVTAKEEAGRHAAFHDVLTGLPNRALFDNRLEHGLVQAQRHGWSMAVMFLDLDGFKAINDSYGHDAGDRVLQTIAQRLRENTRGDDTVSRIGGDEFLYLLMEVRDEQIIAGVAQKAIHTVQAPCDISVRGVDIHPSISVSIGIAVYPQDGTSAAALVERADAAMYIAKQSRSGHAFASTAAGPADVTAPGAIQPDAAGTQANA